MIATLQWTTLAICALVAVARIPSAVRGENRSLFYIFSLITMAILLSIEGPYVAIDQALGGINLANLLLRFVVFAAIYLIGVRITKGFGAESGYRLITGRVGMGVLLVVALAITLFFLLMDTVGSSAGLVAIADKTPANTVLVEYYGAAGRAYPAFVSLALLPGMVRALRNRLPLLLRVAAGLLALGAVAITLTLLFPVIPPEWEAVKFLVNYTAVLCFVIGLALIWASRVRSSRPGAIRTLHTEK